MKKCKSCQAEIDEKAKKCPHCRADQRNWFRRHPILTVLLALFVLGICGSIAGGSSKSTSSTTRTDSAQAAQSTETAQPSKDDLMSKNNPDIKHLITLTADYVGKSFTLYVDAKTDN